ncbi:MAG: alpha/beta hydrolase [Novosphingobium sp.]
MADYYPEGELDAVAADIAAFFAADPAWQAMPEQPVAETRASIRAATPVSGEPEMASVVEHAIPVAGGEIALRNYVPHGQPRALILWVHGGGFCLGSSDEVDDFCRALAASSGAAVGSIEYRLAPEHKFPVAVEDVETAVLWACARVDVLAGADVPVVLGGDSAGANLAAVVTRRLHAAGAAKIAANVLAYPNVDHLDTPSLRRFESPFLGLRECEFFIGQYLPDVDAGRDPDFAVLHAPGLERMPPTLVITASHDILTEQAEAYGEKLKDLGVDAQIKRYSGMIHGFLTLAPFLPGAAGEAIRAIGGFVAETAA